MNPTTPNPVDRDPDDLPRLSAGLMQLHARGPRTPAEIDDAMRLEIRAHFDALQRGAGTQQVAERRWRIGAAAAAFAGGVAALIVLAVWMNAPSPQPASTSTAQGPSTTAGSAPGDVDGSGRIDILDAFQLARRIEAAEVFAEPSTRIFDLTGDGSIDQRDVDAVAMRAVSLTSPAAPEARGRSS